MSSTNMQNETEAFSENMDPRCDPLYDTAVEIVLTNNRASISLVQRNLKIGYNRAARLIEGMEKAGFVSPMDGQGGRAIFVRNNRIDQGASANEIQQCREIVEVNWKAFLTFAVEGSPDLGKECLLRFEEKIARQAREMGKDGERWLAVIEEQRALIFDEYISNPDGLKRRLGVGTPQQAVQPHTQQIRHVSGESLADLAVRTTVRASIWATVFSIFRWFR